MHTARFWMALAIPGGALGYDDDKELGNFIAHMTARTSRRLRKHCRQTLKAKARDDEALIWSLAGFRTFGESKFNVCSHARARPPPSFRGAQKREPGIRVWSCRPARNAGGEPPPRRLRLRRLTFGQLMPLPADSRLQVMPGIGAADHSR